MGEGAILKSTTKSLVYARFLFGLPESERTAFRIVLDPLSAAPSGEKTGSPCLFTRLKMNLTFRIPAGA